MNNLNNKIVLFFLILGFPALVFCQEKEEEKAGELPGSNNMEEPYLRDVSDLVRAHGEGLQFQLSNAIDRDNDDDYTFETISIPTFITRYAFNDHWGLGGRFDYTIHNTEFKDSVINRNDGFRNLRLGGIYELDKEWGFAIFDHFTFLGETTIPIQDDELWASHLDMNWSTPITENERYEIDYVFGTTWQEEGTFRGNYDVGLDMYLARAFLLELDTDGDWAYGGEGRDFESNMAVQFSFLSKYSYQFNLNYERGINHDANVFGATAIITFDKRRME